MQQKYMEHSDNGPRQGKIRWWALMIRTRINCMGCRSVMRTFLSSFYSSICEISGEWMKQGQPQFVAGQRERHSSGCCLIVKQVRPVHCRIVTPAIRKFFLTTVLAVYFNDIYRLHVEEYQVRYVIRGSPSVRGIGVTDGCCSPCSGYWLVQPLHPLELTVITNTIGSNYTAVE